MAFRWLRLCKILLVSVIVLSRAENERDEKQESTPKPQSVNASLSTNFTQAAEHIWNNDKHLSLEDFENDQWSYETSDGDSGVLNNSTIQAHLKKYSNVNKAKCPDCDCGIKEDGRIIDGKPTKKNEFPWVVIIRISLQINCGGSLINDRFVVTSLFCTYYPAKWFNIILLPNIRFENEPAEIRRKVSLIYRPLYPYIPINRNIALLKLDKPVPLGIGQLVPVCLPRSSLRDFTGKTGVAVGWGETSIGSSFLPKHPQKVLLTIRSRATCDEKSTYPDAATNYVMCAGRLTGGNGYCLYDEGGPFSLKVNGKHTLVGVMSKPGSCGSTATLDIFTRVNRFTKQINQITKGACFCK